MESGQMGLVGPVGDLTGTCMSSKYLALYRN